MTHTKNSAIPVLLAIIILIPTFGMTAEADSVYAIPKYWGAAELNVYDILESSNAGQLNYRATYNLGVGRPTDVTLRNR